MTLRPILLAATAVCLLAGGVCAAEIIDTLLNEQTAAEVAQLRKDPHKNKARLAEIGKITRDFAQWQNDLASDSSGTRERYNKMKSSAVDTMWRKFNSAIKKNVVTDVRNELESTSGGSLGGFWDCYFNPDSCVA